MPKVKKVAVDKYYHRGYRLLTKSMVSTELPVDERDEVSCSMGVENAAMCDYEEAYDSSSQEETVDDNVDYNNDYDIDDQDDDDVCSSGLQSSSSESEGEPEYEFAESLAKWAARAQLTREDGNDLLALLRANGHRQLPKDYRTLLRTPSHIDTVEKAGGQFVDFGLANSIMCALDSGIACPDTLRLKVNVDGLPIHKDGKGTLWPILVSTDELPPFVVSLWYGPSKPACASSYLESFLLELHKLQLEGIIHGSRKLSVEIRCFICDAPARAFLKGIKGHNATQACERCVIEGVRKDNTMCYLNTNCEFRTDEGYQQGLYVPHHQFDHGSPLSNIGIGLATHFPIEYMHLVCLGVVRRFISFLRKTNVMKYRISQTQFMEIGNRLEQYSSVLPSEFARRPRSLRFVDRFKATEFRQFLLYTGIAALKGIVHEDVYHIYLSLNIAIAILLDTDAELRNHNIAYAQELFTIRWMCLERGLFPTTSIA